MMNMGVQVSIPESMLFLLIYHYQRPVTHLNFICVTNECNYTTPLTSHLNQQNLLRRINNYSVQVANRKSNNIDQTHTILIVNHSKDVVNDIILFLNDADTVFKSYDILQHLKMFINVKFIKFRQILNYTSTSISLSSGKDRRDKFSFNRFHGYNNAF